MKTKEVSELLHGMFCSRKHPDSILKLNNNLLSSSECGFMLAQSMSEPEEYRDYNMWMKKARQFKNLCEQANINVEEALEILLTTGPAMITLTDILREMEVV